MTIECRSPKRFNGVLYGCDLPKNHEGLCFYAEEPGEVEKLRAELYRFTVLADKIVNKYIQLIGEQSAELQKRRESRNG